MFHVSHLHRHRLAASCDYHLAACVQRRGDAELEGALGIAHEELRREEEVIVEEGVHSGIDHLTHVALFQRDLQLAGHHCLDTRGAQQLSFVIQGAHRLLVHAVLLQHAVDHLRNRIHLTQLKVVLLPRVPAQPDGRASGPASRSSATYASGRRGSQSAHYGPGNPACEASP